jgi:hypothetical protein
LHAECPRRGCQLAHAVRDLHVDKVALSRRCVKVSVSTWVPVGSAYRRSAPARPVGAGFARSAQYDFGDDWEHDIVLEQVLAAEPGKVYPTCVAGKGACPPEDCGGPWGYADLRAALADPTHEQHDELRDWLALETASDFDPSEFEIDAINDALGSLAALR